MKINGNCLFLVFLLASQYQKSLQSCPSTLTNTVVYEGISTALPRINNDAPVQWQVAPSSAISVTGTLMTITNYDDIVTPQFTNIYAVNQSALIIFKAAVAPARCKPYATAGVYILNYQNPQCTTGAGLVVIKSGPSCDIDASDPMDVKLSCGVVFANHIQQRIVPIVTWKDSSSGAVVFRDRPQPESLDLTNPGLQISVSWLPIESNDTTAYECQVTFSDPASTIPSFIATNAPNFTASCFTSIATPNSPQPISTTPKSTSTTVATSCPGQNLTNTVVYEGALNTTIKGLNNGQPVEWLFTSASNFFTAYKQIADCSGNVYPEYNSAYAAYPSQLVILNATVDDQGSVPYATAGLYLLNYLDSNCTTAASLIVIRSGPTCGCDASNPNNVKLTCSVYFSETSETNVQKNLPVFTWKLGDYELQRNQSNPSQITISLQQSSSQLLISRYNAETYECQLTFDSISQTSDSFKYVTSTATNFTASCFVNNCALTPTSTDASTSTTASTTSRSTLSPSTSPMAPVYNCSGQNLANTVVYEGNLNAAFKLLNNGQTTVQWQVSPTSDFFSSPKTITNYDDVVVAPFASTYAMNQSQLKIFNSTIAPQGSLLYSTAGFYVLKSRNPNCAYAANLIVIRNGPLCTCNVSRSNNVTLSCSVDFAESYIQSDIPVFNWRNNNSIVRQQQPIPSQISSYLRSSSSQLSISSTDPTTYECQLTFSSPAAGQLNYVESMTSNFSASCYVGVSSCTSTTTEKPSTTPTPIKLASVSIEPTYGPVAGGTQVNIVAEWTVENVFISAVYIGEDIQASHYDTLGGNLSVVTSAISNDSLLVNQPIPITLEISKHSLNFSTGKYFTYKPNPKITDIQPRNLPIGGGIQLNISGSDLDSVAHPLVRSVVIIKKGNMSTINESFAPCYAPTQNGSQMICLSPSINIREDFLEQLYNKSDTDHYLTDTTYKSDTQEIMTVRIGMMFDGYARYEDNCLLDAGGYFNLFYQPSVSCKHEFDFDPESEDTIIIEGKNMSRCCSKDVYTVRIGNGSCDVKELTDNALTCYPPKTKPQHAEYEAPYESDCGEKFVVFVELGNKQYKCACLAYVRDDTTKIIIIVVSTVGSSLVIFIVIIVTAIVMKKSRQPKHHEFVDDQSTVGLGVMGTGPPESDGISSTSSNTPYERNIYSNDRIKEDDYSRVISGYTVRDTVYPSSVQAEYRNMRMNPFTADS